MGMEGGMSLVGQISLELQMVLLKSFFPCHGLGISASNLLSSPKGGDIVFASVCLFVC